MSRGTTLDQIVEQLRAECRLSTDSSRGLESRTQLVQVINRVYETLYDEFDWEFLNITREEGTKDLQAGQRYYDPPTNLDVDSISGAWAEYGGLWHPLQYGIGYPQFNYLDSDLDERQDPVTHWKVRDDDQIEVWPIPDSNNNRIAFEGKRKFVRLSAGDDRCLLDDTLVVLFAAADVLQGNKQEDSKAKMSMAQARLAKLRGKATGKSRVRIGLGKAGGVVSQSERISVAYVRNQ